MNINVHHGDSREVLKSLPDNSVDSCVTDPPYALTSIVKRFGKANSAPAKGSDAYMRASSGFMGQAWDTGETAFDPEFWREVYRVLKPGAHVVAFSGTRTVHRLASAIEDAGFEIRDQLQWLYGSGFPKSHDVSKGIDKAAGAEREVVGSKLDRPGYHLHGHEGGEAFGHGLSSSSYETRLKSSQITAPTTDAAREWEGWGTALKPACEPIVMARKVLDGTVAANVLEHGTGALNIDGCRIQGGGKSSPRGSSKLDTEINPGWARPWMEDRDEVARREAAAMDRLEKLGRWPANVIHDGSDEVVALFPNSDGQQGDVRGSEPSSVTDQIYGKFAGRVPAAARNDSGSAARFFYTAKADSGDRLGSSHPTVKPVDLMQWLVRLVTPKRVMAFVCESCDNPPYDCKTQTDSRARLPDVQQDLQTEGQQSHGEVLRPGLRGDGPASAGESSVRELRGKLQAAQGRAASVLLADVCGEAHGAGAAEAQTKDGARILDAVPARPSDGDEAGLHHGTQAFDGGSFGPQPENDGSRASRKRKEGRQPDQKLGLNDQAGARPASEKAQEPGSQVPPLQGPHPSQQLCEKCGSRLSRVERPGLVLDPFAGSGTTGEAAYREGMRCTLIEREEKFVRDIERRITLLAAGPDERARSSIKAKIDDGRLKVDAGPLFGGEQETVRGVRV